jgi:hypothetical protein
MFTSIAGHLMYMEEKMSKRPLRHKHLKLDQRKIDFAKKYFGVTAEQEAIDRALAILMQEQ